MGFPISQWGWSGVVDMQSWFSRLGKSRRIIVSLLHFCGKDWVWGKYCAFLQIDCDGV